MWRKITLLLLFYCISGLAIEEPPEAELAESEAVADDDVLELDSMSVVGERLSLKQETRLRVIRHAMNEPRSHKKEDKDKLLCWLETPVGTNFRHVTCARNGDLESLRKGGKDGQIGGDAGYGRNYFWRSLQADNEASIRNVLANLPETNYFDLDFVQIASNGGQPPRDIPELGELTRFSRAYIEVGKLMQANKPEEEVVLAIEAEGLTLKRYNRLAELTQTYQSMRDKVTELVIEQQSGGIQEEEQESNDTETS